MNILALIVVLFLFSWPVMLAAGALGFPIGYWTAFLGLAALFFLLRLVRLALKPL